MLGIRKIILLGHTKVFFSGLIWFDICIKRYMALSFYFIFRTLSLGSSLGRSLGHFFKDVLIDIPCVGCTSSHGLRTHEG